MRSPGMLGGMLGGGGQGKLAQALAERMGDRWRCPGARRPGAAGLGGDPWARRPRGPARPAASWAARRRGQGPSRVQEEEGWPGHPQGRRALGRGSIGSGASVGPGPDAVFRPSARRRATIGGPCPRVRGRTTRKAGNQTVAVKLRLMRMGKKKQPTYRVVAADSRSPRDGRFIEIVGTYAPAGPFDGRARRHRRDRQRQGPQMAAPGGHSPPSGWRSSCAPRERGTRSGRRTSQVSDEGSRRRRRRQRRWTTSTTSTTCNVVDDMAGNRVEGGTRPGRPRLHRPLARRRARRRGASRPTSRAAACASASTSPTGDMGRMIGRRGRVAQAIRTVVRVAGSRDGVDTNVDFVDD